MQRKYLKKYKNIQIDILIVDFRINYKLSIQRYNIYNLKRFLIILKFAKIKKANRQLIKRA